METKLCFFDFDGTIYLNHKIAKANIDAIKRVKDAGHKIVLNTGRSYGFLPHKAKNMADWDGLICGSTYVSLGDEILLKKTIETKALARFVKELQKTGKFTVFEGASVCYTLNSADIKNIGVLNNTDYENCVDADKNIEALMMCPDMQKFSVICEQNSCVLPEFEGMWKVPMPKYQEYIMSGYNKTTGVKLIAEKLGIKRENIIAFGDSLNDEQMLRYAGVSCVIKHAPQSFDGFVNYRSTLEQEGVAELINGVLAPLF